MFVRDRKLFNVEFWRGMMAILSVTGFSVLTGAIMISLFTLGANDKGIITLGSKLALITIITFGVHLGVSAIFGLREAVIVMDRLKKIMLKPVRLFQ
jgi:2-methylisocitrate lyase-like PEP mutase family enzyme